MNKQLNLVFTIDESYIQHFTVALISLLENNKDLSLSIFVINDIQNKSAIINLGYFFKEKYGIELRFLSIESSVFNTYKIDLHISKATYFRLLIADIIPEDIDRAVFLDSDIIVTRSLAELSQLKFNENYVLAVSEDNIDNVNRIKKLGIEINDYFNAGVMLINLKAFREHGLSGKFTATAKKYMKDLVWWDQDVLNICLVDRWAKMDIKFNGKALKKKQKTPPVIIHYTGTSKPWQYLNSHPYKSLYWEYLKLSDHSSYKYKDVSLKSFIRKVVYFYKYI